MSEHRWTEAVILDAMEHHYRRATNNGGPPKHVFARHVRTGSGWDATNIIDAVVVDVWQSAGHDVHAFEVKCSRSDWLREIRPNTYKSAAARAFCDTFTVVAPAGVVKDDLPDGWGLIIASESDGQVSLRQSVKAKRIRPGGSYRERCARPLERGFAVALMRAVQKGEMS